MIYVSMQNLEKKKTIPVRPIQKNGFGIVVNLEFMLLTNSSSKQSARIRWQEKRNYKPLTPTQTVTLNSLAHSRSP